ncbi:MAG: DNA cytosine methyltransferase [Oscillospiraceae bacterium]|nr:DNA cytosine methyltransferase [Oscillospiraceae bacterium]
MRVTSERAQLTLRDELIVDNFAGGGGASTGIELAAGRPVDIAVNHDPAAILMHKTNHPFTERYCESVWDVDPVKVCRGRPVGLAWFSPDCKRFSKAKGAALVDRNIRGLAWVVLRWAGTVRPRVIILENVEEFQTWGPVRKGKPVRKVAGQTFRKWLEQLRSLGYAVEHRELVAADYGTPTTRKRFVLIARCDGRPIVWPKPTHSRNGGDGLKRWIPAADIIDWNLPAYSIFATRRELKERYGVTAVRPLAENTLRRVIRGVDRFTIRSGKPFLVRVPHPASVSLIQYCSERGERVRSQSVCETLQTVDSSDRYGVTAAHLVEYFSDGRPLSVAEPLHTVTSHDKEALVAVHVQKYFGGITGTYADEPLPTVTAIDHNALCAAHIVEFKGQDIGQDAARPLRTITACIGQFAECRTEIVRADSGRDLGRWPEIRALLNHFCGYRLGDDEILLLTIDGAAWFLSDISLRMLTPRELYRAMGFPPDYVIDRDYAGKPYPKSAQVARCGNAVCPPMAAAVVRANFPEWSQRTVTCMSALTEMIAV